jgi:hypothetical protein
VAPRRAAASLAAAILNLACDGGGDAVEPQPQAALTPGVFVLAGPAAPGVGSHLLVIAETLFVGSPTTYSRAGAYRV